MKKCSPIGVMIAVWRIHNYSGPLSDTKSGDKKSQAGNGNLFGEGWTLITNFA